MKDKDGKIGAVWSDTKQAWFIVAGVYSGEEVVGYIIYGQDSNALTKNTTVTQE